MEIKQSIKWWEVILLGAVSLLFLWLFIEMFPIVFDAHISFSRETGHTGLYQVYFYSNCASLYHGYLCMTLFILSGVAFAMYGLFRCFRPAKLPDIDTESAPRNWREVTYLCLAAFAGCLLLLISYSRIYIGDGYGVANGGEWISAADLIIPGWLGIGVILSMNGAFYSLIKRRELRKIA